MKISNPFYSFYAIFFALAMLNAPPPEKDINCYRYKAEAYIVIETSIPEQVEDTVTHHPAGFKCFKDSLTCEKSLTFPDPQSFPIFTGCVSAEVKAKPIATQAKQNAPSRNLMFCLWASAKKKRSRKPTTAYTKEKGLPYNGPKFLNGLL
ncbi:hypothetical protein [Fibrobacter sp. UWH1]|uniref:hypothetical protein n=1 Tax=Fibrobacter sp. UWH1 TaxID=1964354 RepID=UPI000B525CEF|nr:hypothetical protein [Fibrobacter sp. UWH1]OWV11906.1 hypothetical protein B7992_09955 [Fibrobacter sp. UWH1]